MVYTSGGVATSPGRLAQVPQPRCSPVGFHPGRLLATAYDLDPQALIDTAIVKS